MCNLAGYTGSRPAAPILIEMLRREQFIDGGVCTGIATLHEGKIYSTKIVGDVDTLLRETDALNFPGTVGIAHSRPGGTRASQAHPFLDRTENLALVLNGTLRDVKNEAFLERSRAIMEDFLQRGFPIRSAFPSKNPRLSDGTDYHNTEPYALMIGDAADRGESVAHGTAEAISALPGDIVTLVLHTSLPGTITSGRITRPMFAGLGDGETYLATTALAFPEDAPLRNILSLPVASVSQITPGEMKITSEQLKNVRVQEINCAITARAYARMEGLMQGQKDSPKSMYDIPFFEEWQDLWEKPYVDCIYEKENGLLKPYAALFYDILWAFHTEGRLHTVIGERNGHPITKFWID